MERVDRCLTVLACQPATVPFWKTCIIYIPGNKKVNSYDSQISLKTVNENLLKRTHSFPVLLKSNLKRFNKMIEIAFWEWFCKMLISSVHPLSTPSVICIYPHALLTSPYVILRS